MVTHAPRTLEGCVHRVPLPAPTDTKTHICTLALSLTGAKAPGLCGVRPDECAACCQQRLPSAELPNAMVASTLTGALLEIKKRGGVEGCTIHEADALLPFAGSHLLVIHLPEDEAAQAIQPAAQLYAGPCRYLGVQTGERECLTCRGNVRMKAFVCHHPQHSVTTIRECQRCPDYETGPERHAVEDWAIGMTTAPRQRSTLRSTLASLRGAGWAGPVQLFAEPGSRTSAAIAGLGPVSTLRRPGPALGAWPNFLLALTELTLRQPHADAYLMVQDDVAFSSGLRPYLEEKLWPGARPGVVSLHTASHLAPATGTGFFLADLGWSAWGAQAFIFSNAAARAFLSDAKVRDHRLNGFFDGLKNVDSVVGDWCRRTQHEFWLHAPSLVEHIGATSTLWPGVSLGGRRSSADFPGAVLPLPALLEAHRQRQGSEPPPAILMLADGNLAHPVDAMPARGGKAMPSLLSRVGEGSSPKALQSPPPIAVIVTAHAPYLAYLPECLAAWDTQQPSHKILVLDGCDYTAPEGWHIVRGDWRHPSLARNAGIAHCDGCPWIIHWDADNTPSPGFLERAQRKAASAAEAVGVFYSDVVIADATGRQRLVSNDNQGDPRESYFVDTASLWRREAILHIGGWSPQNHILEDWDLGRKLHAAGWKLERLDATVVMRDHPARRTYQESAAQALWSIRPLGIITLFAGRLDMLEPWVQAMHRVELPAHCGLTLVDASRSDDFRTQLDAALQKLPLKFQRITRLEHREKGPPNGYHEIHNLVGRLYAQAIAASPEPLLLTWEDDVFPQQSNAIRALSDAMLPKQGVAAVSGGYRTRENPDVAIASLNPERWHTMPLFSWLDDVGHGNSPLSPGHATRQP